MFGVGVQHAPRDEEDEGDACKEGGDGGLAADLVPSRESRAPFSRSCSPVDILSLGRESV